MDVFGFMEAAVTSGRFHEMAEHVAEDLGYDEVDAAQVAVQWEMEVFDLFDAWAVVA